MTAVAHALAPHASALAHERRSEQFPVVLPLELTKHLWRILGRVADEGEIETSASGIAEVAFELFLEQSIDENEELLKRCLPRGRGIATKRKAYSLPPDLIKRFEKRCKQLNDREDRQGSLKMSIIAEAAFSGIVRLELPEVLTALKRFGVRKRRK